MTKYYMTIDNAEYIAVFADHIEAADFIDANDRDGSEVVVHRYEEVTPQQVLVDKDLENYYRIELAASELLSNAKEFKKTDELERELIRLGYLNRKS